MTVIDTNDDVSGHIAYLKQKGVTAVGRYYSSKVGKRIHPGEAQAIAAAGLKLFVVFEDSGDPPLGGNAGTTDARLALQQAQAIGQPAGSAIYFAMEHLPNGYGASDVPGVETYFKQVRNVLQGRYKIGVYSDGVVCDALLSSGLCDYAWLSASTSFAGSKQFDRSGMWSLAQRHVDLNWNGLSVDLNDAKPTFGEFVPGALPIAAGLGAYTRQTGFPQRCAPYLNRSDPRTAALTGTDVIRWTVPDLCRAYGWPRNQAGGGVIAIVELDGGWAQSDLIAFFDSIGQPAPHISDISIDGTRNNPNQHIGEELDPDVEVALDIQVAAASYYVATGKPANIRIYWAADNNSGSIAAAIRRATADGCDVCSISWGSDEANWQGWSQQQGIDFIADLEDAARAATQAGMIVLASSGDNDSSDGGPDPANVDAPSSCPHVIGCGGTSRTLTTEVVWNDNPGRTNGEGTGGGYSAVFPRQAFQIGAPYPPRYLQDGTPKGEGRMVPDIAANADPNTGYWMFVHGHRIPMGGTSAVAPLYAGLFAALGRKLGFVTDKLWANPQCFNDITAGENGAYQALTGPDPCTGLGSPIGSRLATLLAPARGADAAFAEVIEVPGPRGWSGTIVLNIVDGELVGPPRTTGDGVPTVALRAVPPTGTVTVRQGHRYSATVTLSGVEQFASNDMIASKFIGLGFTNVNVTGSGGVRQAVGTWSGSDTTVQLDSHLSHIVEIA